MTTVTCHIVEFVFSYLYSAVLSAAIAAIVLPPFELESQMCRSTRQYCTIVVLQYL